MNINILKNSAFRSLQFATIALMGFIVLLSACEKDYPNDQTPLERVETYQSKELNADFIFNQIKEQANNEAITIDLSDADENWVFTMRQEEIYNADSKFIEVKNNAEQEVVLEKTYFLSGTDKAERPALIISRKGKFYLEFVDNERLTIVEALTKHKPAAAQNLYIMYTSEDIIKNETYKDGCSVSSTDTDNLRTGANRVAKAVDATRYANITCAADKYFKGHVGGHSLRTFEEMSDIVFLGGARFWFYSDYDLFPVIGRSYIFYSDIIPTPANNEEALHAWTNYGSIPKNDANVLFTGRRDIKDVNAPNSGDIIVGSALPGVICSQPHKSYAYNTHLPTDFLRHQLFAHELAHLFDGRHQPGNGPLTADVGDATSVNFRWQAENQMDIYLEDNANKSCLYD